MSGECVKIHVVGLGFALGATFGLITFVVGLLAMTGYGVEIVNLAGAVYLGYAPTLLGSLLGLLWAFVDGFVVGVLIAAFYNCICSKCGCAGK